MDQFTDVLVNQVGNLFTSPNNKNSNPRRKRKPGSQSSEEETEVINNMETEMKELRSDVKALMSSMTQVLGKMEKFDALIERVNKNEVRLTRVEDCVKDNSEDVATMKENAEKLVKKIDDLEGRLLVQEQKSVDLEARGRRNNGIFHGLKEVSGEDCMKTARDFIKTECKVDKTIILERAHRLGKKRGDQEKPRPLIVKFLDFNDKMLVKSHRDKLKKEFGFSDDLPFAVRQARKLLFDDLDKAKRDGKSAFISFPARLIIDNVEVRSEPVIVSDARRQGASSDDRIPSQRRGRNIERGHMRRGDDSRQRPHHSREHRRNDDRREGRRDDERDDRRGDRRDYYSRDDRRGDRRGGHGSYANAARYV